MKQGRSNGVPAGRSQSRHDLLDVVGHAERLLYHHDAAFGVRFGFGLVGGHGAVRGTEGQL